MLITICLLKVCFVRVKAITTVFAGLKIRPQVLPHSTSLSTTHWTLLARRGKFGPPNSTLQSSAYALPSTNLVLMILTAGSKAMSQKAAEATPSPEVSHSAHDSMSSEKTEASSGTSDESDEDEDDEPDEDDC